ncbi:hypothetical protein ACQR5W_11810 [Xanthomonas sacchari]
MSETKWTPGKFHTTGDGIHRIVRDEGGRILAVRHRVQKDENEALMTLFSAAPELYEALQVAELVLRERGLRALGEYKQIESALAKARGEQP